MARQSDAEPRTKGGGWAARARPSVETDPARRKATRRRGGDFGGGRIVIAFVFLLAVGGFAFDAIWLRMGDQQPSTVAVGDVTVAPRTASLGQSTPAPTVAPGAQTTFVIAPGDTATVISERLAEVGLVPNARLFRVAVIWRGAEDRMLAGSYQVRQGMSMNELIDAFQIPKVREVSLTFIEGRRLEEQAETIATSGAGIDPEQFLLSARRASFVYEFLQARPAGTTLEGYLFPDTYRVLPNDTTADDVIHLMLRRFGQIVTPQFVADVRSSTGLPDLTVHQIVTIASIVEREAAVPAERARIASVYLNRFRDGEGMFADPTVQYAIGKPGAWWPVLRDAPRLIAPDSPYNTYVKRGLPPGPIANPGEASLRAMASPDGGGFKYFVRNDVRNDGTHVFAVTLREHEANRVKYQKPS